MPFRRSPPAEQKEKPPLRDGTVTRVARQQRDPERVSVYLDGAFAFGLPVDVAVEAGLRKGKPLTVAEQEALLAKGERRAAFASALTSLAAQARTAEEVRRKLKEKGFGEEAAAFAVEELERLGYLDDAAYARAYVQGRFAGRGHGPGRLRTELLRRGVARAHVEEALADLEASDDLAEAARRHAVHRWRALASEADPRKRKKKTLDFLLRRGFAFDLARQVVDAVATDDAADVQWEE